MRSENKIPVQFSKPDSHTHVVTVSRVLTDGSTVPIGKILPDIEEDSGNVFYASMDNHGKALFLPVSDFIALEKQFEKYAEDLTEKSMVEDFMVKEEEFRKRETSIKGLRRLKFSLQTKLLSR